MKFTSIFGVFLLSFFFSISCEAKLHQEKHVSTDSISAIKILSNFPIIDNKTGRFIEDELQQAYIFYYKDYILQKQPYTFTFHKMPDSGNVLEIDKVEIRESYFIYKKGDRHGYFTDSSRNLYFLECPVDSIAANFWATVPFIEPLLENFHYGIIDSLTKRTSNLYSRTYFFQNRIDSLQKGTFTTEFSDSFPVVDYSICSRLDTVKKMKLVNLKIFNAERHVKKYNITIDAIDQYQRIELLKDFNRSEIAPFFEFMQRRKIKE